MIILNGMYLLYLYLSIRCITGIFLLLPALPRVLPLRISNLRKDPDVVGWSLTVHTRTCSYIEDIRINNARIYCTLQAFSSVEEDLLLRRLLGGALPQPVLAHLQQLPLRPHPRRRSHPLLAHLPQAQIKVRRQKNVQSCFYKWWCHKEALCIAYIHWQLFVLDSHFLVLLREGFFLQVHAYM